MSVREHCISSRKEPDFLASCPKLIGRARLCFENWQAISLEISLVYWWNWSEVSSHCWCVSLIAVVADIEFLSPKLLGCTHTRVIIPESCASLFRMFGACGISAFYLLMRGALWTEVSTKLQQRVWWTKSSLDLLLRSSGLGAAFSLWCAVQEFEACVTNIVRGHWWWAQAFCFYFCKQSTFLSQKIFEYINFVQSCLERINGNLPPAFNLRIVLWHSLATNERKNCACFTSKSENLSLCPQPGNCLRLLEKTSSEFSLFRDTNKENFVLWWNVSLSLQFLVDISVFFLLKSRLTVITFGMKQSAVRKN